MNKNSSPQYRPCVGLMVINHQGLIFVGRRIGIEGGGASQADVYAWQMPQGGIDDDEDISSAGLRELVEETGIVSVELLTQSRDWLRYDLPGGMATRWKGRYVGQAQMWLALRFYGSDDEINLNYSGHAEFSDWRWVSAEQVINGVVPFKRAVYQSVIAEFTDRIVPQI